MPFIVRGRTGVWGDTRRWTVGVCQKAETAQATVERLNAVGERQRVPMPEEMPRGFSLPFKRRDAARKVLHDAGDGGVPDID